MNKISLPSINDYSSRKDWESACWRKIKKSPELLESAVTSYERHNLVMRTAAAEKLAEGKSYKDIGRELWLSPQTISGIKKAIAGKEYRSYQERTRKKRGKIVSVSAPQRLKVKGRPHRTKFGTIHMP